MSDTVQLIKERLGIVEVVQPYVKLTRAGKYWKGLSPFGKEKTPSFFVSPDRGIYHCFSSGKGGDIFTFIEEMEGVDFKGALKILAEKAGIELVKENPAVRDERTAIYAALDAATNIFARALAEKPEVLEYLAQRHIDSKLIKEWRLGYASSPHWTDLKDALLKAGFTEAILEKAGLIKKADEGAERTYDRFRGRIMFPLFDASGRVHAFSGRIFEDDAAHPQAKYLNSPEGPVFDKSRALYGIHVARQHIRDLGCSMLVEGQVDLLMAHSIGYKNAVATSGTAFTSAHAELLKRYSTNLLIAYDGDKAGVLAAGRAAMIALPLGMQVKVVQLPAGKDPADLIAANADEFKDLVKKNVDIIDFTLDAALSTSTNTIANKIEVNRAVFPLIKLLKDSSRQAYYVDRVAARLGIEASAVRDDFRRYQSDSVNVAPQQLISMVVYRDQFLLGLYKTLETDKPEWAARIRKIMDDEYGTETVLQLLASPEAELEKAQIIASENFFALYTDEREQSRVLDEIVDESKTRFLKQERIRIEKLIKLATEEGNTARVEELMVKLNSLAKTSEN